MTLPPTLTWDTGSGSIRYIDQTALPGHLSIVSCSTVEHLADAIRRLEIRGAPALGVAGAYGIALSAVRCHLTDRASFLASVRQDGDLLAATRPTAINLSWGIQRVLDVMERAGTVPAMREAAVAEALAVAREDGECCHAIGDHGAALLPDGCTVLTHCNAGALACSTWGTALGVIRSAIAGGKRVRVIACETRPLLQGARLTAWELAQDSIDVTVIADSMAAHLMRRGSISCVLTGADRITVDAVFNKIGTYSLAVCARHHGIPFYVAAPLSTFDPDRSESMVAIEERGREEIACCGGVPSVPDGVKVYNPAFDATPMDLVTAIVTEQGIVTPPFDMKALLSSRMTT
jgi:methylthioribose-1-phosphate isomerase